MHTAVILRAGFLLVTALSFLTCTRTSSGTPRERANSIHDQAIVIDAHAHPKPGAAETMSLGEKTGPFELDFITMKEGGLDAVFFSLPLLRRESTGQAQSVRILDDLEELKREVRRFEELAEVSYAPQDISRIHDLGKRAVLLSVEAGDPFGGDVGTIERYFDAGIRMITLLSDSLTTPGSGQGDQGELPLNAFGNRVIEEMNRLGIIIDISHTPDRLQMDIIRASMKPVVASHSCTRALNDVPRQIPDSIIRALAEKGGVISVTFYPGHISPGYPDDTVTVEDLVDHIDHIVEVAGVEHVGFGSDFLGSEYHTVGLESAAGLPGITRTLLERGYTRTDIEKILGGNLLRVFEAAQDSGG
jgi:microsomal dipeptidase-like Zn-dependent dipeptidase